MKSTGDKTQLQKPDYCLGGPSQKEIIIKERQAKKEEEKMKRLQEKADKRPLQDKVPGNLKAANFTVSKMMKGRGGGGGEDPFFSGV